MERKIIELNNDELLNQLTLIGEVNRLCTFQEKNDIKTNKNNSELSYRNAERILIIADELKKRFANKKLMKQ